MGSAIGGDLAGSALGGAASLTPFGAAAGVLTSAVSTPNTSATGDVSLGDDHFGGLTLGGGGSQYTGALIAGAAVLITVLMLNSGRRR
jgi:hypothetical protein